MRKNILSSLPVIIAVALMFTAISCGGGGTSTNNSVPVANPGGPYVGNMNQALGFNGSGSSAPSGKTLTSFAWLFGDGSSGTGASTTHTYTIAGNFTATLTVTDNSGATASSTVAVQIITAPVAKPGGPYTGKVGVAVAFDASASTVPPGQAPGYTWDFGDGSALTTPTSNPKTSHTYGNVCTCNVRLILTDDTGGTSIGTTTATIALGPGAGGESATPSTFFSIGQPASSSSQFAYVLTTSSSGAGSLTIETIDNNTGQLLPSGVTPPSIESNFAPAGMVTDPSRKFLYLYGGNSLLTFQIVPETGALTSSSTTAMEGSPDVPANQALMFSPNGKFAFFITQDADAADPTTSGSVTRFSVDANTGALGAIETVSAQVSRVQSAAIDPAGKFLYVSGFAPSSSTDISPKTPQIAIFAVAQDTAALNPIPESPLMIESGVAATSMAIDSTGRFIYVAGKNLTTNSPALSVFTIDSTTGGLAQSAAPISLGDPSIGESATDTSSLILSPSGGFAYVLATLTRGGAVPQQAIQLFELNVQTGAAHFASSITTNAAAADPITFSLASLSAFSTNQVTTTAGNFGFLFLTNPSDATILSFSADAKTGMLNFRSATNTAAR